MTSFYLIHRGSMANPVFNGEKFSRWQAWCWLIENAAFKATRVAAGGKWIDLERGQITHSLRYMAKAWKWDEAKVRRFIRRVELEEMIRSVADAGQTVITICNYDKYQTVERVADAPIDASSTQDRRTTDADKKELNQVNEKKVVVDAREAPDFHAAGRRVLEAVGVADDPRWLGDYSLVSAWLTAGYDLEMDVLPTIRRIMAQRNGQGPPKTLKYFTQAIADAHAERTGTVIVKPTVRTGNVQRNRGASPPSDHVAARRKDIMDGINRGMEPRDVPPGLGDG